MSFRHYYKWGQPCGTVFRASRHGFQGTFAIKIAKRIQAPFLMREAWLLKQLVHENLIAIVETFESPFFAVFVMPEMLTSVKQWVKPQSPSSQDLDVLSRDVLKALAYLHMNELMHLDIHLGNILIEKPGAPKFVLADLGIADFWTPGFRGDAEVPGW